MGELSFTLSIGDMECAIESIVSLPLRVPLG